MFSPEITKLAQILWDYHHVNHRLKNVDVMLVLGSHDLRVAEYAAKLYKEGYAPVIVVSGGTAHQDDLLRTGWKQTEAKKFAEVMVEQGVPEDKILLEILAKNTGDNFALSRTLLEQKDIRFHSVLVVTKPYMERRAFATGAKQWPDKELVVASPPSSFEEYFAGYIDTEITPDDVLHIMVGDLQRIDLYGRKGFQIPQDIPPHVQDAYSQLIEHGYTKHLVTNI